MKTIDCSSLMLGTAQFGAPYGIANCSGRPDDANVRKILTEAFAGGIQMLDTAAAYGVSEATVGRALRATGLSNRWTVVTKVLSLPTDLPSRMADAAVAASVGRSLKRLQPTDIAVCLLHRAANLPYLPSLMRLRDKGWVRQIGVSVTTPEEAQWALSLPEVDAIQFPASLLDRRFSDLDVVHAASARGVAIFTRSAFLQGLLFLSQSDTPKPLRILQPIRSRLTELAETNGMDLKTLALRYALTIPGISRVLVGVETLSQLRENLEIAAQGPLAPTLFDAVRAAVPALPDRILNPALWPTASAIKNKTPRPPELPTPPTRTPLPANLP